MLYARQDGKTLIVAAADSLPELEGFYAEAVQASEPKYSHEFQPDLMQMMTDDRFVSLRKAPYVFDFATAEALDAFRRQYDIELVKPNRMHSLHDAMMTAIEGDPYAPRAEGEERKTIGEIHNLETDDRWDNRSEQEKVEDAEMKRKYEEAEKRGELSGESFGGGASKTARVTDIRTSRDQDGKVRIDNVLGVKGLHDDRLDEMAAADKRGVTGATGEPIKKRDDRVIDETMAIDPYGEIAVYFKLFVSGKTIKEVRPFLMAVNFPLSQAVKSRDADDGCWFAFAREELAREGAERLTKAGMTTESYAVDAYGERLVAKGVAGVEVVDTGAAQVEPPRPWNDQADDLKTMTPEQLEANQKSYKGAEFVFCGQYEGAQLGCIIYVTPKSWFEKNNTMWPEPLDIAHILPAHVKPYQDKPGVYQSLSTDWHGLTFELSNRRGFHESMYLQIHLNSL